MTANALPADGMPRRHAALRHWRIGLACLLAVAVVVAVRLTLHGASLLASLGDTDDATRLVELHTFLEHGRWWDLTLDRIGAPDALVSHWSRLIDLGLAVTLGAAGLVLSPPDAELVMRVVWPSLVLLALVLLVAREAERDGGIWAALSVVCLVMASQTALVQFNPGRIDHHNVQILCGVGGILMLARSIAAPASGWSAGALIGIGLTVGLESATLVGPAIVVAVLLGIGRRNGLEGQMRAAVMMTATLTLGALAAIDPARLGVFVCDAVALNLVALVGIGAAGVAAAALAGRRLEGRRLVAAQAALLGIGGLAGVAAYGLLEPRCLAGPFGQVMPEAWSIWLSRVTEVQPIGYLYRQSPGPVLGFVLLLALGLLARIRLAFADRSAHGESDGLHRHLMLLAAQMLSFAVACWQVKMMPYAAWLALPALAVAVASLSGIATVGAPVVRMAALVLVMQSTLGTLAGGALHLVGRNDRSLPTKEVTCSETATVSALASLPPGLVLADLDLGPYIAALTPHRVVMAPYHRLDRSIVQGHKLLAGPPEAAEAGLRKLGVSYVVACAASAAPPSSANSLKPSGLLAAVAGGHIPSYLAPVPLAGASALRAFRLLPPSG